MDEHTTNAGPSVPAYARVPFNRCNLPAVILGSLTYQRHPVPLYLDGVAALHHGFFEQLDTFEDPLERARHFMSHMAAHFSLDHPEEAGFVKGKGRARTKAVGHKLMQALKRYEKYARLFGEDFRDNPSPGNKKGGLYNIYLKSSGVKAKGGTSIVEDLVVDTNFRKMGIAKALLSSAIEIARKAGANGVALTSNFQRVEANQLYLSMGFKKRETNAYFYAL